MAPNVDPYDRRITYLRISITDRCNLRCAYCMPVVTDFRPLSHAEILTYEEILKLIHVATDVGVTKVRLTGGEPLLRKDFVHLVASVCRIPALHDVSVTTNGVLLRELAQPLFEAGLRRINVSLDTLNPLKYVKITGRESFDAVWEGLRMAESVGFSPIKVNVVAMKGVNDDELRQFADLSMEKPYHVRFIEYMPIGKNSDWTPEKYISSDEIKANLEAFGSLHTVPRSIHDGPAERYRFKSAKGEIGFISALSHHFCPSCNRLRLTADGRLRPCLFSDEEVDIKTPMRQGRSREALRAIFEDTIAKKPRQHNAQEAEKGASVRSMISIGG
ncbi:MAG: GTP 3',8-cyclase MoaA [Deltaproteobacteria bacterium]|nr:GTP 3',8-cyclase MoaA [Deltaproteobacteria bacterium]